MKFYAAVIIAIVATTAVTEIMAGPLGNDPTAKPTADPTNEA